MKHRIALHRRTLVAAACGGGAVWLGTAIRVFGGRPHPSEHAALAAMCLRLNCPQQFGEACRRALPPAERSEHALARTLVADLRPATGGRFPAGGLTQAARQRSQDDFRAGRVTSVGGWILSLTETRLYALAALISSRHSEDKRVAL